MTTAVQPAFQPVGKKQQFASWPYFDCDEIEAASAVLRSGKVNYWTGEEGQQFEVEFAKPCGTKHAVCLANGTLALELALQAMGIGAGDEVITTSRTFIASASCVVMRGARPVCVDVDRNSQNITAQAIQRAITPRTKAIIAVHLAGWPCDMDPILALATEHRLRVIEDCAQAQGATYKTRPVGSMGDAAAFSFCQDKIMTTAGEGGMLVTNDSELWERAWSFKDHGKDYHAVYKRDRAPGFRWLHDSFGTNWRMTEVQSAIGRVALRKVPGWVTTRRANAAVLTEAFSKLDGVESRSRSKRFTTPTTSTTLLCVRRGFAMIGAEIESWLRFPKREFLACPEAVVRSTWRRPSRRSGNLRVAFRSPKNWARPALCS